MRAAIDATPVVAGRKGIGLVLEGLISAAHPGTPTGAALVIVDESFEAQARQLWPWREIIPVRVRSSLLWETVQLPRLVRRRKIDVVITARDRTALEPAARTIVWLFEVPDHRVNLLVRGRGQIGRKLVGRGSRLRFRGISRRVSRFVVSSDFTRDDLRTRYGVDEESISLIYPGLPGHFVSGVEGRPNAPDGLPYVLHFATGDPRDNTDLAMRSFARMARAYGPAVQLTLAGVPRHLTQQLLFAARDLGISDRIRMVGYVPRNELQALFAGALIYFDPTLFEGFGLQILEAMASGVPVITSDVSSVPEVAGGAAILLAPHDEVGFASALLEVATTPDRQRAMALAGVEAASRFTWQKAVTKFDALLASNTIEASRR